jgi:GTP-binding protein
MTKPVVAIVGRQNVGKSTLLNRLAGKRIAVTEDLPGTTRDRVYADVSWGGVQFSLVDTGGLMPEPESGLAKAIQTQARTAVAEADVNVFLTDARDGVTPFDKEIADTLRRAGKPVILAVNKSDSSGLEAGIVEFYELGLGDPLPVSAYHGRGIAELLDTVVSLLPVTASPVSETNTIKIAIVGRPGVGKSMLLNALVGGQRAIVGENPGTTRDAIDTPVDIEGRSVILIDTAGIRRRGKLEAGVERHSVTRAMQAIDRADVAALVLDASEAFTDQDKHVAGYIQKAIKGVMLIVNKWDLVADPDRMVWERAIRSEYRFVPYAPLLFVSAKFKQGIDNIMPLASQIYDERNKRLPTAAVNSVVREAVAAHPHPSVLGKPVKIKYATQTNVSPPTFVFFVNDTRVHFSYRRYLENKLREAFGFTGTALRLVFKTGGTP